MLSIATIVGRSCFKALPGNITNFERTFKTQSSKSEDNEAEFDKSRAWFFKYTADSLPQSIATTEYSYSSGPGGQKVNKTSSKATTSWPIASLEKHVPSILIAGLRNSRYAVDSATTIKIQSDTHRSQSQNTHENHRKLFEEIKKVYDQKVPGVTAPEVKAKLEQM
ncbi:hypothetical protein BJ878DRAFT_477366 [Calycina marina]|uniref:Prokaryotic-type class I peptide chain release factors domain-containing protein n=1 Tax=Calycina marina TaxID=1763456 RepID=A0A9P8CJF9_9HELO|nr:hypothetical protein BJ878DRAFT_477366 [Calycina marina]